MTILNGSFDTFGVKTGQLFKAQPYTGGHNQSLKLLTRQAC